MVQIITNNSGGGGGGGGASYTAGNGIDITSNVISVDETVVQTVGNMVDNLTGADDDHYPTAKAVADAISGGGSGDVIGPASSTDGDIVLFDGATGKIIKDSGVGLSSKLDASALSNNNYGGAWQGDSTHTPTKGVLYDKIHTMDVEIGNKAADTSVVKLTGNQTINGTKTFGTSPVVPSKTSDATNTGTAIATEAQVYNVAEDVATINGKIPSAATSSNQLADKDYVNDSINSVTAYYITKNAAGDQWATYAELAAATTFYSGGAVRVPTRNDYTIVLADENHDDATTRYIYNSGWEYQYTVNETALTQAQLDAINSGITADKVTQYDGYASSKADDSAVVHIAGAETITGEKTFSSTTRVNNTLVVKTDNTQGLDVQSTSAGGYLYVTRNPGASQVQMAIKAGTSGGTFGTTSNHQFQFRTNDVMRMQVDSAANGGKVQLASASIPAAGDNSNYVPSTSWVQGELAAKQDTLVSGTNIKTINSNSILGSGNLEIDGLPSQTGQAGKYLTTDGTTASWGTVSGGITNDTTGTTTTVAKIWAGTEAEYSSLATKDENTIYYTF